MKILIIKSHKLPLIKLEVQMMDKYFDYRKHKTDFKTEVIAGVSTFLTMAYILIVNPLMLTGKDITFMEFETGIPYNDALVATAVASFVACIIMGLWANLPFALAPGMGLNAYFLYTVCFGCLLYTYPSPRD